MSTSLKSGRITAVIIPLLVAALGGLTMGCGDDDTGGSSTPTSTSASSSSGGQDGGGDASDPTKGAMKGTVTYTGTHAYKLLRVAVLAQADLKPVAGQNVNDPRFPVDYDVEGIEPGDYKAGAIGTDSMIPGPPTVGDAFSGVVDVTIAAGEVLTQDFTMQDITLDGGNGDGG